MRSNTQIDAHIAQRIRCAANREEQPRVLINGGSDDKDLYAA